jgi:hypothetical protein
MVIAQVVRGKGAIVVPIRPSKGCGRAATDGLRMRFKGAKMTPIDFKESNESLDARVPVAGVGMQPLSVFRGVTDGTKIMISCWQLTPEELAEVQRAGRVWLLVFDEDHPVVHVAGESPFGPPVISHESTNGDG